MTYIEAIGNGFPGVFCHIVGNDDVYENIVYDSGIAIPDKTTLDQWMLSNPTVDNGTKITVLAFRNRFTPAEKISMELSSLDNPSATIQQRQLSASIRVSMRDSDNASYIDLNRPETIAGVTALETYGIIGAGRASIILNSPVTDIERYIG